MDLPYVSGRGTISDMDGYGDYCPVSRGADILATRWTPLIVRNLLLGSETFTELREGCPGISRTLLTQRLRMLEHHGIIDRRTAAGNRVSYHLAPAGKALGPVIMALGAWGEQWIELAPEHFNADRVVWGICIDIHPDELPDDGRYVIRFDVPCASHRETYWLLIDNGRAEVCRKPPGDDDDFVLRADPETLVRWHMGEFSLGQGIAAGNIHVEGPRWIERLVATWGGRASFEHNAVLRDSVPTGGKPFMSVPEAVAAGVGSLNTCD